MTPRLEVVVRYTVEVHLEVVARVLCDRLRGRARHVAARGVAEETPMLEALLTVLLVAVAPDVVHRFEKGRRKEFVAHASTITTPITVKITVAYPSAIVVAYRFGV